MKSRKKKLELYDATSDMNEIIEGETSSPQMMTARTSPQMITQRITRSMGKETE